MIKLIAFNGGYGSGKSTAIEQLQESLSRHTLVIPVKFAGPLYDMQEFIYRRIQTVHPRPDTFIKDRKLLQWLGTEWGRGIDQNLWVNIWKEHVQFALKSEKFSTVIVCDDCRFDNEAEAVRSLGGIVVKINRDNNAAHAQGGTGIANHASEAGISSQLIDYVIDNNSSLEAFKDSLSNLFAEVRQGQTA